MCSLSVVGVLFGSLVGSAGEPSSPGRAPTIAIGGSERMVPLVRKLAEQYRAARPEVTIEVSGGGSAAGLERLADGAVTLALVARPATDDERRHMRYGRRTDLVGIPVAVDAVAFFVNRQNGLTSLTMEQIERICRHQIETWEQLGVSFEEPIERHMLGQGSGSVKVLQARAMKGKNYTLARVEHELTLEVVNAVASNRLALGFAGMGYTSGVDVVPIRMEADSPPVLPTPETIRSREYPLAHYLYFYFAGQPDGPARDFLRFVVSAEGQQIVRTSETGAVPLPMKTENP